MQPTHLLFVLVVALLVLGPKRLPEVARSLGNGLRDFRSAISGEHQDDSASRPSLPEEHAGSDEPAVRATATDWPQDATAQQPAATPVEPEHATPVELEHSTPVEPEHTTPVEPEHIHTADHETAPAQHSQPPPRARHHRARDATKQSPQRTERTGHP